MLLATALLLALAGVPARAAGGVSCSLSATPLAFGQYVPFSNVPDDFTATITVSCIATGAAAAPLQGTIGLTANGRLLSAEAAALRYQTYLDAARTVFWGDGGTRGSTQAVTGVVTPAIPFRQSYTVYGRIPARQSAVRVGSYADRITAVLNY